MKVSIVTATFNSSGTISNCISSVNDQYYDDIEHIIIDGSSNDNTLEIISKLPNRVTKIISEPDNGLYDAMNKGISLATGEIIGILNSDDLYFDNHAIELVMKIFENTNVDCVYGDLYYVNKEDTNIISRHWITNEFKPGSFYKGWHPAHPSFFLRKRVYDLYGKFDLTFKLASDFELMLRMLERYQITSIYVPKPLVKMRLGGETNKNFKNIFYQNIECVRSFNKNGLTVSIFYPIYRLLPKIKQFFSK
jgi:glycosyltransferase involved in cell wall biosynthesis